MCNGNQKQAQAPVSNPCDSLPASPRVFQTWFVSAGKRWSYRFSEASTPFTPLYPPLPPFTPLYPPPPFGPNRWEASGSLEGGGGCAFLERERERERKRDILGLRSFGLADFLGPNEQDSQMPQRRANEQIGVWGGGGGGPRSGLGRNLFRRMTQGVDPTVSGFAPFQT